MKNNGKDRFGSTFIITMKGCPQFHGINQVVGRICKESMDKLDFLEQFASESGKPTKKVYIAGTKGMQAKVTKL